MPNIQFNDKKARAVYDRVLRRAASPDGKKKVREMFIASANANRNPNLSAEEALAVEQALNKVDRGCLKFLNIIKYDDSEIHAAADLPSCLRALKDAGIEGPEMEKTAMDLLMRGVSVEEFSDLIKCAAGASSSGSAAAELIVNAVELYSLLDDKAKMDKNFCLELVKTGIGLEKFRTGAFGDYCRACLTAVMTLQSQFVDDARVVADFQEISANAKGNTFLYLGTITTQNLLIPYHMSPLEEYEYHDQATARSRVTGENAIDWKTWRALWSFGITNIDFDEATIKTIIDNHMNNDPAGRPVTVFIAPPDIAADISKQPDLERAVKHSIDNGDYLLYYEAARPEEMAELVDQLGARYPSAKFILPSGHENYFAGLRPYSLGFVSFIR
jgi:hypothetical protein